MGFTTIKQGDKMSKKYNHMMDMAFEIETDEKVWYNIPKPAIIAAVLKRIADVVREDTNVGETFSRLATHEVEDCVVEGGMIVEVGGIPVDWTFHTTDDYIELEDSNTYSEQMQDELEPIEGDEHE
jgi:hypothetical protein